MIELLVAFVVLVASCAALGQLLPRFLLLLVASVSRWGDRRDGP